MKNKLFLISLAVLFSFTLVSAFSGSGDGSLGNPFQITNCTQVQEMQNSLLGNYILTGDIDCSDTINWNGGSGFFPISNFLGNFNGQNFIIYDLYIYRPLTQDMSLFYLPYGNISNVNLRDVNFTGYHYTSGIYSEGGANVYNSSVTGVLDAKEGGVNGGIAGSTDGIVEISNCFFNGSITGGYYTGGIIGYAGSQAKISNSYVSGSITGGNGIGGLVGLNEGLIENSYSNALITGSSNFGGLVGVNIDGNLSCNVFNGYSTNCLETDGCFLNTFDQDCRDYDGDEEGCNSYNSTSNIGNCVWDGDTSTCNGLYWNGVCNGFYGNITITITNSFWDINTSGQLTSAGNGIGKITAEMKNISTFSDAGWNIAITENNFNNGYAYLGWQKNNETTWLIYGIPASEEVCGIIPASNYTVVGGTLIGADGSPFLNTNVNMSYDYTYKKNSQAGGVISDTVTALGGTTTWFPIIIVITAMVVLIFLVVLIVRAVKNTGFTA